MLLDSPSSFLPKPRTANRASFEGVPVSPRFTPNDPRRSPVPKFNLPNDLESISELPPLPSSSPLQSARTNETPEGSDAEGEIYVEFLKFEHYEIVDLSDHDTAPSSPQSPSQPWPASPRSHGSSSPYRGDFLTQKPRDGS